MNEIQPNDLLAVWIGWAIYSAADRSADVSAALDMPVGSIGPTRQRCLNALRKVMSSMIEPAGASPCEST